MTQYSEQERQKDWRKLMEKPEVINLVAPFLSKNILKIELFFMPKGWDCDLSCQKVPEQDVGWIRKE
jgi:hypothetical protein